jgi:hypothetical protein
MTQIKSYKDLLIWEKGIDIIIKLYELVEEFPKEEMYALKEIKSPCRTFQICNDPELIHVIKTGFKNRYMIVHEDAYEFLLGKVEFKTREEIKKIYDIEV